jgi:predicted 2-oxoglutarate/Fe(II)-dependent dioxygenase YbiX
MRYMWYTNHRVYSPSECEEILNACISNKSDYYYDRGTDQKKVNTSLVETKTVEHLLQRFFDNVEQSNEEYFGFKLFNRPRTINLNIYENDNNEYPYHNDAMAFGSSCDVKLTAILNLSPESYTGGELEIFDGKDSPIADINQQGNMIVFPSSLYHRVKPVTGKRISLSAWFVGPNWR